MFAFSSFMACTLQAKQMGIPSLKIFLRLGQASMSSLVTRQFDLAITPSLPASKANWHPYVQTWADLIMH
jgi:hypothetical protein